MLGAYCRALNVFKSGKKDNFDTVKSCGLTYSIHNRSLFTRLTWTGTRYRSVSPQGVTC